MALRLPTDDVDLGRERPARPDRPQGAIHIPALDVTLSFEDRLKAYTALPAFVRRRRGLEVAWERFWRDVADRHAAWLERPPEQRGAWVDEARAVDLAAINARIEAYNAYFPIEANLATDPRTGAYRFGAERWSPEPAVTVDDVVAWADTAVSASSA